MRRESHVRFWESAGVRFLRATRLVRSIMDECLDRLIPIGECHFRRAVAEFVAHYHGERNHQGLDNRLIAGTPVGRHGGSCSAPTAPGRVVQFLRAGGVIVASFARWNITGSEFHSQVGGILESDVRVG